MRPLPAFALLVFFLLSTAIAEAGEQTTLSPNGGHDNQRQINAALELGDVYLSAGVYEISDTIILPPNRALKGDANAIVRVWGGSSQWFVGLKGLISCGDVVAHDNEIAGFQVDGNIANLPKSYADSAPKYDHDAERCIILHGYSAQFCSNIKIHDMTLHDSFSDGVYILFGENIEVYNNVISDCQHEGVYFSCLKNSIMHGNKIAGICSDSGRLDNCVNCKVYDNLFFSFTGESYGQYKGGQAGIQTGDSGSSHGYDASKKPQSTKNLEIYNNTFASPGRMAIWNHADGSANVYIHNNLFIDSTGLETQGTSIGEISKDISESNPPSVETSEKVFTSILDFLKQDYVFQYPALQHDFGASATVTDTNESATVRVTGKDLKVVKFEYDGKTARHFIDRDIWTGELSNIGDDLYIPGHLQPGKMQITVYGDSGYQKVEDVKINEVNSASVSINPDFFIFIAVLTICGISIARNFRRMF